ncbi:MAG: hypothetical protein AAGF97_02445 [Planctomycetota bacterium]
MAPRLQMLLTLIMGLGLVAPAWAQTTQERTARIILGPQSGTAKPTQRGMSYTGGGNIEITQPTPDTVVITMGGSVAAASTLFTCGEALLNFIHEQQFAIEFSDPMASGKLYMQVKVNGLLRGAGPHASVGMNQAISSLFSGPNELATVPVAPQAAGGCDSAAITTSQGPVCVPVSCGCYSVRQQFSIYAMQSKGLACAKASAQFSPGSLGSTWVATRDPFQSADASNLGYQLILRVVPDAHGTTMTPTPASSPAGLTQLFPGP